MTLSVLFLAFALQEPELSGPAKPFRARVRIESASKRRDGVQLLEGTLRVRPGEALAAELADENRRRIRIDVQGDDPPPERFPGLEVWRRTTEELRARYDWRPDAPPGTALPEAVGDSSGRPRPPVPARLGPGARVVADGTDPREEGRTFRLVPRDPASRDRVVRVTFEGPRLTRAVVDGPDGLQTIVLSDFREVGSMGDSVPEMDSGNPKWEERR
jgi:hypothetical protein